MAEQLGSSLEQENDWNGAAECYHSVIEVEPLAEIFYHHLKIATLSWARRTEALAVYQRCQQSLLTGPGITLQEIQNLYQSLVNGRVET